MTWRMILIEWDLEDVEEVQKSPKSALLIYEENYYFMKKITKLQNYYFAKKITDLRGKVLICEEKY